MKILTLLAVFILSACSTQIIDMTTEPTVQKFDLSDMEGDGIIAARDKCPESDDGAQVDNTGCGTETIETLRRKLEVNFDTDSYIVKAEYLAEIEELANFMAEHPHTQVTIEGHTSIRGSAEHNQMLSQNRAEAIKLILISEFGISAERINAVGYGFERLLLEGNDEYIHARNRRIVAELSTEKKYVDMKWDIYSVDNEME